MGVRIFSGLNAEGREAAVIYDSVTDTAFGPIFRTETEAEHFLAWLEADQERWINYGGRLVSDARVYSGNRLEELYAEFRKLHEGEET